MLDWFRRAARAAAARPTTSGRHDRKPVERSTCSTCGRTSLPMAGGWDPPICTECDAAINFDALPDSDTFEG